MCYFPYHWFAIGRRPPYVAVLSRVWCTRQIVLCPWSWLLRLWEQGGSVTVKCSHYRAVPTGWGRLIVWCPFEPGEVYVSRKPDL